MDDKIYTKYLHDIIEFFKRRLPPDRQYEAEELAHDTFIRYWKTKPEKLTNARAILYVNARQVVCDWYRRYYNRATKLSLKDIEMGSPEVNFNFEVDLDNFVHKRFNFRQKMIFAYKTLGHPIHSGYNCKILNQVRQRLLPMVH